MSTSTTVPTSGAHWTEAGVGQDGGEPFPGPSAPPLACSIPSSSATSPRSARVGGRRLVVLTGGRQDPHCRRLAHELLDESRLTRPPVRRRARRRRAGIRGWRRAPWRATRPARRACPTRGSWSLASSDRVAQPWTHFHGPDRLRLPLHEEGSNVADLELGTGPAEHHGRRQNAARRRLGHQARRQVHRVPHDGKRPPVRGADVGGEHPPGVDPHPQGGLALSVHDLAQRDAACGVRPPRRIEGAPATRMILPPSWSMSVPMKVTPLPVDGLLHVGNQRVEVVGHCVRTGGLEHGVGAVEVHEGHRHPAMLRLAVCLVDGAADCGRDAVRRVPRGEDRIVGGRKGAGGGRGAAQEQPVPRACSQIRRPQRGRRCARSPGSAPRRPSTPSTQPC